MINKLKRYTSNKKFLIFDFDRTLAKMEIDWTDWHPGVEKIYAQFDPNHGYQCGKNPHEYNNKLVKKYGTELVKKLIHFNTQYEATHLMGFTPYHELVNFITNNNSCTLYIYSSNSRQTVKRGLREMKIANKFKQIITRDDVKYIKPDPQGLYLINGFAENKEKFLMIGDSDSDKDVSKAGGIDYLECNYFEKYQFEK